MGLDMYAYTTSSELKTPVDFDRYILDNVKEIYYWRKHPDLHGWMGKLYFRKGGLSKPSGFARSHGDFMGPVQLTLEDLDQLEFDVSIDNLPYTTGMFFGESGPEDDESVYEFIELAKKHLNDGDSIFYKASW